MVRVPRQAGCLAGLPTGVVRPPGPAPSHRREGRGPWRSGLQAACSRSPGRHGPAAHEASAVTVPVCCTTGHPLCRPVRRTAGWTVRRTTGWPLCRALGHLTRRPGERPPVDPPSQYAPTEHSFPIALCCRASNKALLRAGKRGTGCRFTGHGMPISPLGVFLSPNTLIDHRSEAYSHLRGQPPPPCPARRGSPITPCYTTSQSGRRRS